MDREAIEKWLGGKGKWLNFSLDQCGAYLKNGEITLFYHFVGQGHDINVYEKTYDKIVYFTDYINDWTKDRLSKADVADRIEHDLDTLLK